MGKRNPPPPSVDDDDDIDPVTGMTAADYAAAAEEAYAHRHEYESLEEVEFEVDPNVREVVSVRFRPGELGPIERAANALGVPFSTFIRNAAINAAVALDIEEAKRAARAARDDLDRLLRALEGTAAATTATPDTPGASRRARGTKAAKAVEPKAVEPRAAEPRAVEPKAAEQPKRRRKAA